MNRKLDLYNNKVTYGDDPIDFAYRKIVKLYQSGGNAALGLYYDAFLSNGPSLDSFLITDKTENLTFLTNMFNPYDYEPAITIVQNKVGDLIVQLGSQQYLIRCTQDYFSQRGFIRISTSLADSLGEILFEDGLEALLLLTTQQMKEASPGITFTENSLLKLTGETEDNLPFMGPYGIYFKELFFHIPALIANHLKANQKFKEAKEWYEKIFDPTAQRKPGAH